MSSIDATADLTFIAIGAPHGFIYGIRQQDVSTGIWYDIFPEGQQGRCKMGGQFRLDLGIQNDGQVAGRIYVKVTRLDTNVNVMGFEVDLAPGGQQPYSTTFTMPSNDLVLRFEIGHY